MTNNRLGVTSGLLAYVLWGMLGGLLGITSRCTGVGYLIVSDYLVPCHAWYRALGSK